MAMIAEKKDSLFKLLLVFAIYLVYTQLFTMIFNFLGIKDSIAISFLADLLFFVGIIYLYKNSLSKQWKQFIHEFKITKKLKIILGGVFGLFLINILGGMITDLLFSGQDMIDKNTETIYQLGSTSLIYTIFKVTIFSAVAEELVFRKAIRDVLNNSIIFVIISSLIYALMNIAYADFHVVSIVDLIQCFVLACFISVIYVRCNNIIAIMFMKLVYSLIPLTIMLTMPPGVVS